MSLIPGQRNLKVHFAGAEQIDFASVLHEAGVQYFLFTCFPFISKAIGIDSYPITVKRPDVQNLVCALGRHTIMDSGLFTLMFGAHAGKKDKDFILKWLDLLCDFVNSNKLNCTCVEVDCQKVLGVKEAWEIRQKMAGMIPNNRIINVFHIEDGMKGLDRMIEYSDYMAISVPEMRIVYGIGDAYKKAVIRFANYIKNKKPEIDIHLLGCTAKELLKTCSFCTSVDSTSWNQCNKFGQLCSSEGRINVNALKKDYLDKTSREAVAKVLPPLGIQMTENKFRYYGNYYIAGKLLLKDYTKFAGDQT